MERVKYTDAGGDTISYLRFPDGLNLASVHDDMDFEAIASFPLRDDDVLICSYPRTGCHWLWEITRMLQTGRTDFEDAADKEDQMLEFKFHGELDHVPSPRILSSHFHFRYLPRDVLRKRIKILFIYRNPKDAAVSLYNIHATSTIWEYKGKFSNWLSLFLSGQEVLCLGILHRAAAMERVKYTDAGGDTIRYLRFPDGLNLPSFHDDMDFEAIASFPLRDDDVLICSYPRTGCHWTWEITRMLQTGRTDFEDAADKEDQMLEFKFHGELDHVPSPRILSSHFHFRYLPRDVLRKRIKILFIYRNPKDAAVSLYNMHATSTIWEYKGKFSNWLPLFLSGQVDYGAYSDYLLDWEREIAKHPDLPVHVLSYEALHRTPATDELAKLSSFLGKNYTASFLKSVADACSFQRIVKRKGQKWANSRAEIHGNLGDSDIEESFMYRKGKVGDWKNWFSVAESEEFDRHWSKAMMGSKFA